MVVEQKSRKYVRTRAMTKIGKKYRWKWNKRKTIYLLILLIGIIPEFFGLELLPGESIRTKHLLREKHGLYYTLG